MNCHIARHAGVRASVACTARSTGVPTTLRRSFFAAPSTSPRVLRHHASGYVATATPTAANVAAHPTCASRTNTGSVADPCSTRS